LLQKLNYDNICNLFAVYRTIVTPENFPSRMTGKSKVVLEKHMFIEMLYNSAA
jgi:hypothetical protein